MGICIGAVRKQAGIISVHDIVDVVLREKLVQELGRQIVGNICSKKELHELLPHLDSTPYISREGIF